MANVKISELNSLSKKAYNDVVPIVDVSANETKKVSIEELVNNNVSLIAVSGVAPEECQAGDKYYNTGNNLIYTATGTDTWSSTGESPIEGIFYIVFEEQTTYAYDGTTLISVGGGAGSGGGDNEPIGKVVPMVLETAPDGYLLCDGSTYTKAAYPDLYKALRGTQFIIDTNSFNVPNIKGRVIVGKDSTDADFDNIGETGGEKNHTLTIDEMPSHNHKFLTTQGSGIASGSGANYPNVIYNTLSTENTGGGQAHNILQPYTVLNYFIKAQKLSGDVVLSESLPVGTEVDFDGQASDIPVGWEEVETYSTSEVKTGDTWIDDKPIYRKVITFTTSSTIGSWSSYNHNINNIDTIIPNWKIKMLYSNNWYDTPNDVVIETRVNQSSIDYYLSAAGFTNTNAMIILEYTKTND